MNPASHVIEKCGGVGRVSKITGRSRSYVYRWSYPSDRGGLGGRVPFEDQVKLLAAAEAGECDVTPKDFFYGAIAVRKEST